MFISLKEILKNELFKDIEILAGEKGTTKVVKRISVFDCPCDQQMLQGDILKEGDIFITCLEQFRYESESIHEYIETLIRAKSAGLFIITDERVGVITEDIIHKCDREEFPLVLIRENIPYATIIDTVDKYIAIDNLNSLNMLKLEKIMYGYISLVEKMEILYSINPNIQKSIRVIEVEGDFDSDIARLELHAYYLNKKSDIYVCGKHHLIFILSDEDEKALRHHSDAAAVRFKEFINQPIAGYSRIYNRRDIDKALEEARRALETAKAMNITSQTYDPLSSLQLLLCVKDTPEAQDFYRSYVDAVAKKVSSENLKETLLTIENYVANSGSFVETAKAMNQHENTIRYRVNKVKSALAMEHDNIKFNETIAVAVKLRTIINESL